MGHEPGTTEGRITMETPARAGFGSTLFWRVFALINLATVVWVFWVIWQLVPRPVVNDFVLRMPRPTPQVQGQRTASGTINVVPAPHRAAPEYPPPPSGETSIQNGTPMGTLRLETAIKAPPK
ncbi:MAG: hypothetical protein A3G25_04695 [Betaproteobacteria bacterium RIFCSPLOWO2_12_FULL_63_13]|nr:MAG: hypothetical protein A3G25_04695 [Betaproteobacteria bacterium RIFCSPLOWO2_12_FULL_63_13]